MLFRSVLTCVLAVLASATAAHGQGGTRDPIFSAVPFDRWVSEGDQTHFRWTVHVGGAELGNHQRLETKVEVQVDGNELVSRRGHGQLVVMIQFQDSAERVYQTHGSMDLEDVQDEAGKSNIEYTQGALVLPGDYRVSVVIADAKTKEHSAVEKALHVNPMRNDPLPEAWTDLPPVEMLQAMDAPDSWFLPYVSGRLQIPLTTRHPVHIDVVMNASPSGPSRGLSVGTVNNRNLANMVPALKVLSQIQVAGGGPAITLLDIPKRNVMFQQDATSHLDWAHLRDALTAADPNKIDVHALENSNQDAQFFVDQVRARLGTSSGAENTGDRPLHVVIVFTAPMTLNSRESKRPLDPVGPDSRVYYVRYHLPADRLPMASVFDTNTRSRSGRRGNPGVVQPPSEAFDSLPPLLKPVHPRTFDIYSPEQFRKALSSMLEEIARM